MYSLKTRSTKYLLYHPLPVSEKCIRSCRKIVNLRNFTDYQHTFAPYWGVDILFLLFPVSGVRSPTWFPDILGNSCYPIFTKFGMQVYWVNSLYGIAFGDDSCIAN